MAAEPPGGGGAHAVPFGGQVLVLWLAEAELRLRRTALGGGRFGGGSSGAFGLRGRRRDAAIVCCGCAAHAATGVVLPCVLLRRRKRSEALEYLLLAVHGSNRFELSCQFELDYEMKEDVRLLGGPTVLWRHADRLFYISPGTGTVRSPPVQLSSVVWAGEIEGEGTVVLGVRTARLQEDEAEDGLSASDRAIWGTEFFGYAIEAQKMLASTCFMPHAYSRVVSSVHVCKSEMLKKQLRTSVVAVTHKNQLIWFQDGHPKGVCELPYEKPWSIKTAVTSGNHLLFIVSFASGNVCVVRSENLQVASKWQKVKSVLVDDFVGCGTDQLLLLFKDDSSTDLLSTFKITDLGKVNYESGINYKDDVPAAEGLQENGLLTIQALEKRLQYLLKKTSFGRVVQLLYNSHSYRVSDDFSWLFWQECWPDLHQATEQFFPQRKGCDFCRHLLVSTSWDMRQRMCISLLSETTAGLSSVRELQQHLGLKKRVLTESCRALIDLVEERSHILPAAKKEGLVSLWDDVENPPHSLSKEASSTSKVPDHFVEKLWQRVVGESLVVGVKLTESFSLSLSDVSLSLVVDQDFSSISPIIECRNKIIKLNKAFSALSVSSCQIEPPPKKMKLDLHSKNDLKNQVHKKCSKINLEGAKTVTAVTSLSPLLAFHCVCCVVLLHAKKQKHQNDGLQKSKKITLLCGKVLLSLEDISDGKYSVKMLRDNSYCTGSMEDILAVLAASMRFSFQIQSSDFTLTSVNSWLLGEMECTPFKECHDYMFCHKAGNVYGTVFNWTLKSPFEGVLTLFCRSLTVLFQCLHSLTKVLPPSCDVKLLKSGSKDVLTEQLALALEKEILTSQTSLSSKESKAENSLIRQNEPGKKNSDAPVTSLLDSEDKVQQFRMKLQNEREESVLNMNQTMNGTLYQEMALKLAEAQLSSDMVVWRLNKS